MVQPLTCMKMVGFRNCQRWSVEYFKYPCLFRIRMGVSSTNYTKSRINAGYMYIYERRTYGSTYPITTGLNVNLYYKTIISDILAYAYMMSWL